MLNILRMETIAGNIIFDADPAPCLLGFQTY